MCCIIEIEAKIRGSPKQQKIIIFLGKLCSEVKNRFQVTLFCPVYLCALPSGAAGINWVLTTLLCSVCQEAAGTLARRGGRWLSTAR